MYPQHFMVPSSNAAHGNRHIAGLSTCVRRIGRWHHKVLGTKQWGAGWNGFAWKFRYHASHPSQLRWIELKRLQRLKPRRFRPRRSPGSTRTERKLVGLVRVRERHVRLPRGAARAGGSTRPGVPRPGLQHNLGRRRRRHIPRQHPRDRRAINLCVFPDAVNNEQHLLDESANRESSF